ncbi:hemicentin-1-like [Engraulis encrasicolus]|uniref:hemicentin-1-like n=1 Tax=Engraulis encrasicolus TaxID=184585 RepID=UPI002FD215DE
MTYCRRVPLVVGGPPQESVSQTLGTHATLLCEASGVPAPTVTWLKDGTPIESSLQWQWSVRGSRLELGPLQLSHAGTYSCLAENTLGHAQKQYTLTVQVSPSILDSGRPSEVSVSVGGEVTLECRVVGTPPPQVTWIRDGHTLHHAEHTHITMSLDGSSLSFSPVALEDGGTYTCLASSPAGQESKIHTLLVMVPPSIAGESDSSSPREVVATQDSTVTMECQTTGSPAPLISWLRNGRPLSLSARTRLLSQDTLLRISPVQLSDSGVYTCVAQSRAGRAELNFDLQVQVPPGVDHVEPTEQVTVVTGSQVALTCEARGVPPPVLTWLKDGQELSLQRNLLLDGQETRLLLPHVLLEDAGLYSCTAANQAGSSTKTFNLTVLEPPRISGPSGPEEMLVALGSELQLECVAEGTPPPSLSWLKDGRPLGEESDLVERAGQILRINKVTVEDAGLYTCLATSPAGEDGKNHWVRVQVPPTLLGSDDVRLVTVPMKGHLTLECQTDGDPPPTIEWIKDDQALQLGGRIQSAAGGQILEIGDVRAEDSGHYSCRVTNMAGSTSLFFTVDILLPPVIREGSSVVTAHVNQDAVLPCEVEGGTNPSVVWRRDTGLLALGNGRYTVLSEGSLRVESVQATDAGRYYCSASNAAGSDHKHTDLRVSVPPSISPGPLNVTVTSGLRALLSCDVTGSPVPTVTWRRNGNPINTDLTSIHYRLLPSGSLVLLAASEEDDGYFECVAENPAGEERRLIQVTLQVPPTIEDDVTMVTAVKMSPVTLPCHSAGRPQPLVTWSKNGAQLGNRGGHYRILPTGALEITASLPSHAGRYTCAARNPSGVAYKHTTLSVQEPPEIRPMAEEIEVVLHQGVVLPCDTQGFPRPSITWQREGVPLATTGHRMAVLSNGALKFSRVTLGDAGTYQCLAQNSAGTAVGNTRLVLQVPPVLSVPVLDYSVVLGGSVSLECVADGQPPPQLSWTRDHRPLVDGTHTRIYANGTLHLTAVTRSNAGTYTCSAHNAAGRASQDIRLTVQIPPMIPVGQSELSIMQGFQALLPCAAQGLPEPRVSWERRGVLVPNRPGKYTTLRSGELIIERAEAGEVCVFTCVATNAAGSARHDITLSVNVRPAFKELPLDLTLNKGQKLLLPCHAQGTPTPTVTWSINNTPLTGVTVDESGRSTLVIENVTAADAGTYMCVAENTVGSVRALSFVRIREPPSLRGEAHTSQSVPAGGVAMLDCAVIGDPLPNLRWFRDGRPLLGSTRLQPLRNGSLAVYSATSGDSGEYRCVAESEAGTAERTITLRVQIPGGYSSWQAWGPCSVTCGRGMQERIRSCDSPAPSNGGPPCEGASTDTRGCQASLCPGESPRRARGSLIGMVNEREFGVAFLEANITDHPQDGASTIQAHVDNVPPSVGPLLRVLVCVFTPIYWSSVLQSQGTVNGYTHTHGHFRQESQLEFPTGEVLKLTHVARGLDPDGVLLVDIVINGYLPPALANTHLNIQEFDESYVQTGPGQLYAWSSQNLGPGAGDGGLQGGPEFEFGDPLSVRCNHSLVFEGPQERQGPLLQLLKLSGISGLYSSLTLSLELEMTATLLLPDGEGESCPNGFVLDTASYCTDEDECEVGSPCSHSCNNIMGGFSCTCPTGFSISPRSHTCQDIDECVQGSHMCHYNQLCVNTVGTYRCQAKCGHGFKPSLTATGCEDVDECRESSVSPCQHQCVNTLGSYRCSCHPGYQMSGHRCLDINECLRSVCPANQQCRNTEGGYECVDSCPSGFTPAEDGTCSDIDECQDGSHLCRYTQVCQNTVGGYGCVCPRGYSSQGVGRPCIDIDECLQSPSPCAFQCRNVPGSFRCLCPAGTVLLGDGRSCAGLERGHTLRNGTRVRVPLRPQLVSTLGRPYLQQTHLNAHLNPNGRPPSSRSPRHGCPPGYTSHQGACMDIDECAQRKPCQHECVNTQGSYSCTCPPGYQLTANGRTCRDIDECSEQGIQCGPSQMCFNTRGGYQCLDTPCPAQYTHTGTPGMCYRPCSRLDCAPGGSPLLLQYKLLPLPLGIPANHNVVRLSAFSEAGVLQERTSFRLLEQQQSPLATVSNGNQPYRRSAAGPFGIRDERGRGIIFTVRPLDSAGLVRLRVQATTLNQDGRITYQSIFIIYISISTYPY